MLFPSRLLSCFAPDVPDDADAGTVAAVTVEPVAVASTPWASASPQLGSVIGRFVDDRPFRHDEEVGAAVFLPDGKTLITATNQLVLAWNLRTKAQVAMWTGPCPDTWIRSLAASPTGDRLAVACRFDEAPVVLDRSTGRMRRLPVLADRVRWGSDGVIAAWSDDRLTLVDGDSLAALASFPVKYTPTVDEADGNWLIGAVPRDGHDVVVGWSRDGERWHLASDEPVVRFGPDRVLRLVDGGSEVYDLATGEPRGRGPSLPADWRSTVAGSARGLWVDVPGGVALYDPAGTEVVRMPASVEQLVWSGDGRWILQLVGRAPMLFGADGKPQMEPGIWGTAGAQQLLVTAAGRFVIDGSDNEVVWSDREKRRSALARVPRVAHGALRDDGVAFVGGDAMVRIGADGVVSNVDTDDHEVCGVGFTPGGAHVWAVTTDRALVLLRVYDAESATQVYTQTVFETDHADVVATLDPAGELLIAGDDGHLWVQRLPAPFLE